MADPSALVRAWKTVRDEPVGIVDPLGYLYCRECADALGKTGDPVRSAPHKDEPCERCHDVLDR